MHTATYAEEVDNYSIFPFACKLGKGANTDETNLSDEHVCVNALSNPRF